MQIRRISSLLCYSSILLLLCLSNPLPYSSAPLLLHWVAPLLLSFSAALFCAYLHSPLLLCLLLCLLLL